VLRPKKETFLGFQVVTELPEICPKWGKVLLGHKGPINAIEFTPDGKKLTSASGERRSFTYGITVTGKESKKKSNVLERAVKVWDAKEGLELATFKGHSASVRSLAISADSRTVFSGSLDSTVRAWETPADETSETKD
jgi:WD40 repeat protein